jgi:hypothetical protein
LELFAYLQILNIVVNAIPDYNKANEIRNSAIKECLVTKISCTGCEISIPSPEIQCDNISIKGEIELELKENKTKATIMGIMVHIHPKGEDLTIGRKMIENLSFNFELSPDDTTIDTLSELRCNISYKDILLILSTAVWTFDNVAIYYMESQVKVKYELPTIQQAQSRLMHSLKKLNGLQIFKPKVGQKKINSKGGKLSINFAKPLNIMLIQDFRSVFVPLFNISIDDMRIWILSFDTSNVNESINLSSLLDMNAKMKIENYNYSVSKWESFIESIEFQVKQEKDANDKPRLIISVPSGIEMTVSDSLIANLYDAMNSISPDKSITRVMSSPFINTLSKKSSSNASLGSKLKMGLYDIILFNLKNESGYPIVVENNSGNVYAIDNGETVGINAEYKDCVSIVGAKSINQYSITFGDFTPPNEKRIKDINLLNLEKSFISVGAHKDKELFMIEKTMVENLKTISIRSQVKIYSYITEDLYVFAEGARRKLTAGNSISLLNKPYKFIVLEDESMKEGKKIALDFSKESHTIEVCLS